MLSQPDIYTMQFGQHAFLIMMGFGLCPLGILCVLKHGMSLALDGWSSGAVGGDTCCSLGTEPGNFNHPPTHRER
jgi:hypothetical protein